MATKIIELVRYRSIVRAKNGVAFPQVYRLEASYFDVQDGRLVPGNIPAPICYTLTDEDTRGYANPSWTPISHFDPAKDNGWLIVRHHMRREFLDGYLDAMMDMSNGSEDEERTSKVYRTREGIFTLQHRQPVEGAPNNLIIYTTKMLDSSGGLSHGMWLDQWHIVHSDGTITDDIDPLFYPNEN